MEDLLVSPEGGLRWPVIALAGVVAVLALMRVFSSQVYDVLIIHMTSTWYRAVLSRLGDGERLLDVGIGTGTALLRNKEAVLAKGLRVVGIDYDAGYIAAAGKNAQRDGVPESVLRVACKSIFDKDLGDVLEAALGGQASAPSSPGKAGLFDAAYFSGSWTLMPNPVLALRIAASFVKDDGKVYVTQTFQRRPTPLMGVVKPMLKYVTTIDFGPLHYERHLDAYIAEAARPVDGVALTVLERTLVPGSIDNKFQGAYLIVFAKATGGATAVATSS